MTNTNSRKSPPPPPPPPPPRRLWSGNSVTRREIEKFWSKKRLVEEDHFLAAIKAAARLRASRLSEEDYLLFLEENKSDEDSDGAMTGNQGSNGISRQEIRVGIKDWWTKSKYAYLNQPAVGSTGRTGRRSRRSNYSPSKFWLFNYKYSPAAAPPTTVSAKAQAPAPFLGVF